MYSLTNLILETDKELFCFINSKNHYRYLNIFMRNITHLGSTVFSILLPLFLMSLNNKSFQVGKTIAIHLVINQVIVQVIKRLVNRPRPYKILKDLALSNVPKCNYSFPSGHTNAAFTTALILGKFFPLFSLVFLTLAFLVGVSRIYLGVHYPTDVLCGIIIAHLATIILSISI
ncbi:phosphatase PAP2 family protein [Serpentinicella alkaliphila]|uniref:Undecaprenyl-diphosphatase n=1 Tax=Serpentinicella alkaliphila TaxID=1734049 RepID=A0A4R2TFL1_9FIRM|nr:phosphatase PAP2 family protein [Serpentinicella alkaliphila]QUH25353.1 phosphatase PAP2 family protein [Serpentinicella alkaliphila]TCQ02360.1 undecaprenyl-diphosphatase [Serpentinicella alkaliphila]